MEKIVLVALASGVVVDRSVLISLTSAQLQEQFYNNRVVLAAPKVRVVDTFASFFNSTNMLALIEANNDDYKLVAEKAGISISQGEVAAMQRAVELRKEIAEKMIPPTPTYPFATVPDGWAVDTHIKISGNKVTRKPQSGGYSIGLTVLKRVWNHVSPEWANSKNSCNIMYVDASGYNDRGVTLGNDTVNIGCQAIKRFELEQFALSQGWDFPAPKS